MESKKILIILDGYYEENSIIKNTINNNFNKIIEISPFYKKGYIDNSIEGYDVDSLSCIFNILGYKLNEEKIYERAYFEAISKGYNISDNESVLRCNLIKVYKNKLHDFTGGLNKNLEEELINGFINDVIKREDLKDYLKLVNCSHYRNLLFINEKYENIQNIKFYKPHENVGKEISNILPKCKFKNEIFNKIYLMIELSKKYFKSKGYDGLMLFPWGLSKKANINTLNEKYSLDGYVVAGIDLIKGMGLALGLDSVNLEKATGNFDTSLDEKLIKSKEAIKDKDFLFTHINGCDELAHTCNLDGKVSFINKCFDEFVNPFINYIKLNYNNYSIIITGDHITNSITGKHEKGDTFYLILSSNKINDYIHKNSLINIFK
ncbi:hypothetical protein [Clostridium sp. Ade.TY]|uniref:hypothetical protein n=1 Tax=Clostridium sp. Ade.TY TaxID=1391647 RepID=UPI00040D594D|nr:hypothetical protein [Clostridium sp. Ade.TY]